MEKIFMVVLVAFAVFLIFNAVVVFIQAIRKVRNEKKQLKGVDNDEKTDT